MSTVRCFVAAFVTGASARRLQGAAFPDAGPLAPRRDGRPVPVGNYHVTLKFLGDVPEPSLPDVLAAVAELDGHPVRGSAVGLVGLPRPGAARLAAAELAPVAALEGWWAALQARLGGGDRAFRPHVTVLRWRRPRPFAPRAWAEPVPVELQAPRLYRSDLGPDGPRYRPVAG